MYFPFAAKSADLMECFVQVGGMSEMAWLSEWVRLHVGLGGVEGWRVGEVSGYTSRVMGLGGVEGGRVSGCSARLVRLGST